MLFMLIKDELNTCNLSSSETLEAILDGLCIICDDRVLSCSGTQIFAIVEYAENIKVVDNYENLESMRHIYKLLKKDDSVNFYNFFHNTNLAKHIQITRFHTSKLCENLENLTSFNYDFKKYLKYKKTLDYNKIYLGNKFYDDELNEVISYLNNSLKYDSVVYISDCEKIDLHNLNFEIDEILTNDARELERTYSPIVLRKLN